MNKKHYAFFLKKNRKKNPIAKDLYTPKYKKRIVKSKKIYNRKDYKNSEKSCGSDLKQHVNGKISYIPHINNPEQIKFEAPKNG